MFVKKLPILLIFFRLILVPIILFIGYFNIKNANIYVLIMMYLGLFSDIFDGIIARKLNISTIKLRRLDSQTDLLFWLSIGISTWFLNPLLINSLKHFIQLIFVLEVLCYCLSFLKFGKETCTHALLSKFWGITLLIAFTCLLGFNYAGIPFYICIVVGIISHIDVILITLLLPKWETDIPSCYHAWQIRMGKQIQRNKIFNG